MFEVSSSSILTVRVYQAGLCPLHFQMLNKPYFFGYLTEFFSFLNNPDGSRSLALFRKGKTFITAKISLD